MSWHVSSSHVLSLCVCCERLLRSRSWDKQTIKFSCCWREQLRKPPGQSHFCRQKLCSLCIASTYVNIRNMRNPGIVQEKNNILSSFAHSHVIPNLYNLLSSVDHIKKDHLKMFYKSVGSKTKCIFIIWKKNKKKQGDNFQKTEEVKCLLQVK